MTGENRKPLFVLVACAVVAVLLLALGVGLGLRTGGDDSSWQARLDGVVSPAVLRPADLSATDESCVTDSDHVTVVGECTFTVSPSGGPLSITGVTRQAQLSVSGAPVVVAVTLDDRRIAQTLKPGDRPVRLTFGRNGGTLQLTCVVGPCVVAFAEGDS